MNEYSSIALGQRGDIYFNTNNIPKAQYYYRKQFENAIKIEEDVPKRREINRFFFFFFCLFCFNIDCLTVL
jgi:hypothetical protein